MQAWIAQAERTAARRWQGFKDEWAAPPAALSPEDYAAAGFEFYEQGSGRRDVSGNTLHVNFSPDLQHQALFLASPQGQEARLWVDGRVVRVPVDHDGDPRADAVTRWLNAYFSSGLLQGAQNMARAVSLRLWCSEVRRMATQSPHSFTLEHPAPPRGLTPQECKALGFGFHNERTAYNFLDEEERAIVQVDFSPGLQHQAVLLRAGADWTGALLWVDGESVPVPRGKDGDPMCENVATWLDDRFVYAQVGGLWDHALSDPATMDPLGKILGVLIWDTLQHSPQVILPKPAEGWTNPIINLHGNSLRIYADQQAATQDRADRELPIRSP